MPRLPDLRVLLVDDHDDGREILAIFLEHEGATVLQARDGAEALSLVRAGPVDAVLANLHMPKLDGLELIRALRSEAGVAASVPAIAISGDVRAGESPELAGAGFSAFFSKPLDLDRMLGVLSGLVVPPR
ncbi:MAG: response regulator [Myxococcota bacterium]|nr:response regulator [Myxococcota bacterium]